jgi:hypothetical protein
LDFYLPPERDNLASSYTFSAPDSNTFQRIFLPRHITIMSSEKRPAAESLGTTQLVKRQKSDASMSGNRTIAVVNGNAQNGALIQAVCISTPSHVVKRS